MAAFAAQGSGTVNNPTRTILFFAKFPNAFSGIAGQEIFFWKVGCSSSADIMIRWTMQRGFILVAAPVGTLQIPAPLANSNRSHASGMAVYFTSFSAEPQYTSDVILWRLGINQRASYHVKFNKKTGGIYIPASDTFAYMGIGLHAYHESAVPTASALLHFRE